MQTIENIKKVSLGFFLALGAVHIFTTVLIANDFQLKYSSITSKIIAIPFAITALIYGFASLRLLLTKADSDHKILDITLASLTGLTLVTLLVLNLSFPNL